MNPKKITELDTIPSLTDDDQFLVIDKSNTTGILENFWLYQLPPWFHLGLFILIKNT